MICWIATDKPPINPPLTDTAIRVEDRWVDRRGLIYRGRHMHGNDESQFYANDSMVVPTYIDAVVPGINKYNSCLYFFKVIINMSKSRSVSKCLLIEPIDRMISLCATNRFRRYRCP